MNDEWGSRLAISRSHYAKMLADVEACAPEEACGLVAGKNWIAEQVYVVTNALHSPSVYRMDAQQQIEAFLAMEKNGQELLAIYHSHPAGPSVPSETDRAEFAYPGVITLIWWLKGEIWDCRAYWIRDGGVTEAALILVYDQ